MKGVSIGLFNDSYEPIIDGVTITVRNYAYWLNRTLGPTCVVAPASPFYSGEEAFPVVRFLSIPTFVHPPYRIGLPNIDLRLRRLLRRREFSILHAHSPFGAGRVALKTARAAGIPIVATFHSKFRDNLRLAIRIDSLVDELMKRIVEFYYSVNHVWVPQESVAETLREYGYDGPYDVVENGIDYHPPDDISPYRAWGGRLLGMGKDAIVGLFVGQGCARCRLQGLVSRLGIGDRVVFYGPIRDREQLAALYSRSDLFLFPSLWDNAPLVIREAAAFKTPSILLKNSTAAEVIRDGVNGFLADADAEAFAAKVVRILENPRELELAGLEAQRSLCRTWEHVVSEVRQRYLSILSRWSA